MALSLQQVQQINVTMTPQLRQAIELLQYSTYDLYTFIQQEITENPFLEMNDSIENTLPKTFTREGRANFHRSSAGTDHSLNWVEDTKKNPRDELMQVAALHFNQDDLKIVTWCIHHLDDQGFLVCPEETSLPSAQIEKGIGLLQEIGPAGLGARTPKECLLLQVKGSQLVDPHMQTIISQHFDLFLQRRWSDIAKHLELSLKEVKKIIHFMKQFHFKPMIDLSTSEPNYVIPDIVIREKEGRFTYELNDRYLPNITLNNTYRNMAHTDHEFTQFMRQKMQQVDWLQKSLEMRRQTMTKIMDVILNKQEAFLRKGMQALEPCTLQDIAKKIDMHESTVSRATSNKFVQTPHGIFEFKSFFTSKMNTACGEGVSQQKVKALLKQCIEKENKQRPLSDQKISSLLKEEEGVIISRRTIAKYREELNIPSSRVRKQLHATPS